MPFWSRCALLVVLVAPGTRIVALAQTNPLPIAETTVEKTEACPLSPGDYQSRGYVLRKVAIDNLFNRFFLFRNPLRLSSSIAFPVAGQPFKVKQATDAAAALKDLLANRTPENESPFNVTVVIDYIENCSDSDKQLDLFYRAFTSRVPIASGLTLESRAAQNADPTQGAGAIRQSNRVTITPLATYSLSDRLRTGAAFTVRAAPGGIFQTLSVSGQGSTTSHLFHAEVAGSGAPGMRLLDRAEWRFSFSDNVTPTEEKQYLAQRRGLGQLSAQSRPFGGVAAVLRYGLSMEGGDQNSNLQSFADHRFVSSTSYASMRAYAGLGLNTDQQSLSASYGLLLGRLPGGGVVDYRKHIVDVAWDSRYKIADHTIIQLETRATAGWLQAPRAAPISERFFGGNIEHYFIEGDSWQIRSNPVIRSIPDNRLNRSSDGSARGGENFAVLNITASIPAWRYPLIPTWLSHSPTFKSAVEQAQGTARSQAVVYYRSKDPAQKSMETDAAQMAASVETLFKRLSDIQATVDSSIAEPFGDCLDEVDLSRDRMAHLKDTGFGPISTVILPKIQAACQGAWADKLNDSILKVQLSRMETLAKSVSNKVAQVRNDLAEKKADEDLSFAFHAIDTFVNQVNALSVGPAVLFDFAHIGPQVDASAGGIRKGVGLGARVTVMNVLNLTGGYAWTISPRPWEKSGALFFSLSITDLLR